MTLSEILSKHNNSQSALARSLNVTRQAVNTWVKNGELPLIRQIEILANANDLQGIKDVLRTRVSSL
jgi:transcriptional regulator with XRE-family HTH domain